MLLFLKNRGIWPFPPVKENEGVFKYIIRVLINEAFCKNLFFPYETNRVKI